MSKSGEVIIVGYGNVTNEGVTLYLNKAAKLKTGMGYYKEFWVSWDKIGESLFEDYTTKQEVDDLNKLRKKGEEE